MKIQIKKSTFYSILIAVVFTFAPFNKSEAQVNINISSQALWGPTGYDYVQYYYLPEADAFYSVGSRKFIYWDGHQNVYVNSLPSSRNVNLYTTYKVVVNKPKPYMNHGYYVSHYKKYKHGGPKQYVIKDSHHEKYYVVKGHPKHNQPKGNYNRKPTLNKNHSNSPGSLHLKPAHNNNSSKGGNNKSGHGGKKSKGGHK